MDLEIKKLPVTAIDGPRRGQDYVQLADYCFNHYCLKLATLPFDVSFQDLMKPTFWAKQTHRLQERDLIRVIAADCSNERFDLDLEVVAVGAGGVVMRIWQGNRPPAELYARADAAAARHAR